MSKTIAFYLPQYHPIKENDQWWGKGFTEWTNVTQAKSRYKGHHQPQIPSDLGFYDLRTPETRLSQAKLAKSSGIHGFCYYHYWFNGKQLLETPLKSVLESKKPDFPFCVCWANENWTRAWDGRDREVLIKQEYTIEDSISHINYLLEYFKDDRYIKVNGRPMILIYRPDSIPDSINYFNYWNKLAKESGFSSLYICAVKNGFVNLPDEELLGLGYSSIIDFQPNRKDFPQATTSSQLVVDVARKILPNYLYEFIKTKSSALNCIDYSQFIHHKMKEQWPSGYMKFPVVFPSWDNTARRKTPTIIQNTDPVPYSFWLKFAVDSVSYYSDNEQFVFINAWNEWAEGCHLEPDLKLGHTFLKATKEVLKDKQII